VDRETNELQDRYNGQVRQFKPSAKGKWDVLVSSTMQISVGDQIRVTAGFRESKNVFKNNDVAQVREVTDTELVLHDGRRMRRDGARLDQGVCITSHASQCRTVDQVVVMPDGADAKGWYVSLSRAREAMRVYARDKAALRQSVMQPGERKSVWEFIEALRKSTLHSRDQMMPFLWATRQAEIVRETGIERQDLCLQATPGSPYQTDFRCAVQPKVTARSSPRCELGRKALGKVLSRCTSNCAFPYPSP
jgi:hypothetical protein